jgi:hypothetical protein
LVLTIQKRQQHHLSGHWPYTPAVVVEFVFMMLILKLPIVYLAAVCWWAIRAEPRPLQGAVTRVEPETGPRRWRPRPGPRPRRGGPHGSTARSPHVRRTRLSA